MCYGESFKGSKCYEVQMREPSPWLEGSWERPFALATALPVPGSEGSAGSAAREAQDAGAQARLAGHCARFPLTGVLVVWRMVEGEKIRARF